MWLCHPRAAAGDAHGEAEVLREVVGQDGQGGQVGQAQPQAPQAPHRKVQGQDGGPRGALVGV